MISRFKHIKPTYDFSGEISRITTDKVRLYSSPSGKKYPSITSVMSSLSKDSIAEWKARVGEKEAERVGRIASSRGTAVHDLMEKYVYGHEIDKSKLMPHHKTSLNNLAPILDERLTEYYDQEKMMWSDYLKVAGQMDLAGRFDSVRSVIDFKTSGKIKKKEWISNYFMQGTAYSIMFEERTGIPLQNIVIIMDIDNHKPIVFKEHRDNWVVPLQKAISEYYKNNVNGD